MPPFAPAAAAGSYSLGVTRQMAQPSGSGQSNDVPATLQPPFSAYLAKGRLRTSPSSFALPELPTRKL